MATYWENSCSFGLRYVSWYKYLIVGLVFSHLGFWSGNLFLIAPFPDLCLLVPFSNPRDDRAEVPLSTVIPRVGNFHLEQNTILEKGTSRQRSGKGAIRERFPLQKPRWEKTKLTIRYLYHETYRKPNEQLFSQ